MSNYDKMPGIRRSDLWVMNKSPMHFKYHMETPHEQTPALKFGAAVHKFVLEPFEFWAEYITAPEVDRRTKAGKETWADFEAMCKANGLTSISEEDVEKITAMNNALCKNEIASALFKGEHERAFTWVDDLTGEPCKCKVDVLTTYDGKPYVVDYKTTDSCEDGHFERAARKYGYQFQAGMYCEGVFQNTLEEHGFIFVAQEKTPPYASRVYICSPEWIKQGYDKFRELIGMYHECRLADKWPGYDAEGDLVELVEE